ncbi:hypothetical protein KFL_008750020 [Klebsormidium nitens]|uniref:CHASE domain-containing protein n=1 Tax=Klebsormidium nitens TaxID=105231 RepID=A0A1Y1IMK8_KLENI|nr:hypothetical protein KFL_008750020 [Klebsormidium nitens]|eukprot:GAQ91883.1 hypothetical protein KFL_008750020 [Klebsormidium nitens]
MPSMVISAMKWLAKRRSIEYLVLAVWTLAGCAIATAVFSTLYNQAIHVEDSGFNLRCINRAQVLSSDLAARYDLANMYSGLIATQSKLTQESWTDFSNAVAAILDNTVTVAWLKVVKSPDRLAFEEEIGQKIFTFDFETKIKHDALEAELYVVTTMLSNVEQMPIYMGYDVLNTSLGESIRMAILSGRYVAGPPYTPMAGGQKASTYFPSYVKGFNSSAATPEERWAKAQGVIVGTLPPVVVQQEAFAKLVDYQDILVRVYDVTGGLLTNSSLLYATAQDSFEDNVPWSCVVDYVQGGRNYEIRESNLFGDVTSVSKWGGGQRLQQ